MADFKGRKREKSHVQNMFFFGGSGHGPEPSCQISAYYKLFQGKSYFYRTISETKINSNTCLNLNIPNFDFFHNDSPTNAEGVGIYVNQSLKYKLRNDLLLNVPYQIAKIYGQKF